MRAAISGLVWTTAAVSDSTKKPSSLAMLSMRAIAVTIAQLAIGAFSATYLRWKDVVIIPIRLGVGYRAGINAGYLKFTKKGTVIPF